MFNYGDKAKDRITGYEGTVTAKISYFGMRPDQYILESMTKEGYSYSQSVDENRLVSVNKCDCVTKATRVHLCDS